MRLKLVGFAGGFGGVTGGRVGSDFCRVCFFNTGAGGGVGAGLATGLNGTGGLATGAGFGFGLGAGAVGGTDAVLTSTSAREGMGEAVALIAGTPLAGSVVLYRWARMTKSLKSTLPSPVNSPSA